MGTSSCASWGSGDSQTRRLSRDLADLPTPPSTPRFSTRSTSSSPKTSLPQAPRLPPAIPPTHQAQQLARSRIDLRHADPDKALSEGERVARRGADTLRKSMLRRQKRAKAKANAANSSSSARGSLRGKTARIRQINNDPTLKKDILKALESDTEDEYPQSG